MTKLSFVGLSDDGSALMLAASDGSRYTLTIDERLRSAARGSRVAELETSEAPIGAKEIQARMRAGATPQEVSDASGWSVDRVSAFAAPVLQERSWIAEKAQACPVGRGDDDPSLQELVTRRLAERGIDSTEMRWDAWLREDGVWTILLAYPAGQGDRVATWAFDPSAKSLVSQDDEARWFTEDRLPEESRPRLLHMPSKTKDPAEPTHVSTEQTSRTRPPESMNHPAGRAQRGSDEGRPTSRPKPAQTTPPRTVPPKQTPPTPKSDPPSWDEVLFGSPNDEPGR